VIACMLKGERHCVVLAKLIRSSRTGDVIAGKSPRVSRVEGEENVEEEEAGYTMGD